MKAARRSAALPLLGLMLFNACGNSHHETAATTPERQDIATSIYSEVSFSVISADTAPPWQRLKVRLNKPATENVVRQIALILRARDTSHMDRMLIFFFLPDAELDHGPWARASFEPDLRVSVSGFTAEQAATSSVAPPLSTNAIGRWIDNSQMASQITIYRKDGKIFADHVYSDRSVRTVVLTEKRSSLGRAFFTNNEFGEHYVVTSDGGLQIRDKDGLITTAKVVK
jgi:hypothetical protein